MDVALQLGMPLAAIGRMPEREFRRWAKYAQEKGLPFRRLEYGLARVCQLIAQTMGGATNAKLTDYLFDPEPEVEEITDEELAALKAEIGFNPDK